MKITAVVVRPQDGAVLVLPTGLPEVEVADRFWFPDVEAPVRALRSELGIEATALVCLETRPDTTAYLMESLGAIPPEARWAYLDHPLVTAAQEHLALPADQPVTPLWTRPGWYAEALGWIDEQLDAAGSPDRRTGAGAVVGAVQRTAVSDRRG